MAQAVAGRYAAQADEPLVVFPIGITNATEPFPYPT